MTDVTPPVFELYPYGSKHIPVRNRSSLRFRSTVIGMAMTKYRFRRVNIGCTLCRSGCCGNCFRIEVALDSKHPALQLPVPSNWANLNVFDRLLLRKGKSFNGSRCGHTFSHAVTSAVTSAILPTRYSSSGTMKASVTNNA